MLSRTTWVVCCVLAAVTTNGSAQTSSSPWFRSSSTHSNALPHGIGTIDVDLDGHLDLVVAAETFGIEWMKGNGKGLLAPAQPILAQPGCTRLATGAIDAAAPNDCVVINRNAKSFQVVRFSGGTITAGQSSVIGATPTDLELVDFTGDGHLDLVVTTDGNPSVRFFRGDGTGAFSNYGFLHTGSAAVGIAVGDFEPDGDPDLLIANTSASVTPLRNEGLAAIVALPNISTTGVAGNVEASDLDGDGKLDFLTVDATSKFVRTFSGNGSGSFTAALSFLADGGAQFAFQLNVTTTELHDLNGDGFIDLTVATEGPANFSWLGNGHGAFAPEVLPMTLGGGCVDLLFADLDEDGVDDSVLSATFSSSIAVLLGSGTGEFGHRALSSTTCRDSATVDVNDDGNADLVLAQDWPVNSVVVQLGNGFGDFIPSVSYGLSTTPGRVLAGDLTGDAVDDIVVLPENSNSFQILQGVVGGTFGTSQSMASGAPYVPTSAELIDLDLDGDLDLIGVAESAGNSNYQLQMGTGSGNFATPISIAAASSGYAARSDIEDMNADGYPDFVYVRLGGFDVRLSGPGGTALATHAMPTHFNPAGILLADLDGDTLLDVATGQAGTANAVVIYHGFGDGTVSASIPVPVPSHFSTQHVTGADLDGDLDVDLLVQNSTDEAAMISNRGNGQFTLESLARVPTLSLGLTPPPLEFTDIDGDSDLDVIAIDRFVAAVLRNGPDDPCAGSFAPAGAGCPGSGGFTPYLQALGCPSPGKTVKLALSQGLGGSVALLVFGAQPAALPIGGGCQLHAFPLAPIVIPVPLPGSGPGGGSITIGGTIPAGAGTLSVVTQFFTVDPGVALGYAGSNAVQINQQ